MEYKINPKAYMNIFAVPSSLVDENIRLAGVVQLKVLLYMLRYANDESLSIEKISNALALDKFDVSDALVFWCDRGILFKGELTDQKAAEFSMVSTKNVENFEEIQGNTQIKYHELGAVEVQKETPPIQVVKIETTVAKQEEKPIEKEEDLPKAQNKKMVSSIPLSRPTHEQVVKRLQECEELKILFQEAQNSLGKTIGYDGQSVLIMMHDTYGLPVEVIMMLIEYAVTKGKTSFNYMAKIARSWSELEIETIEQAIEYIEEHDAVEEVWNKFIGLAGLSNRTPTTKQRQFFVSWVKEFKYDADMIYYAYEDCIDHTEKMSLPYMDKIIRNWDKKNVRTPVDIQREKEKWTLKNQNKKAETKKATAKAEPQESSYDIDEYMKKSIGLKYEKVNKD